MPLVGATVVGGVGVGVGRGMWGGGLKGEGLCKITMEWNDRMGAAFGGGIRCYLFFPLNKLAPTTHLVILTDPAAQ